MKMTVGAKVFLSPAEAGESTSTMVHLYVSQLMLVIGRNSQFLPRWTLPWAALMS